MLGAILRRYADWVYKERSHLETDVDDRRYVKWKFFYYDIDSKILDMLPCCVCLHRRALLRYNSYTIQLTHLEARLIIFLHLFLTDHHKADRLITQ